MEKHGGDQAEPLMPVENRRRKFRTQAKEYSTIDTAGETQPRASLNGGNQADCEHQTVHDEDHGGGWSVATKDSGDAASGGG